jgi:hypothetical protein
VARVAEFAVNEEGGVLRVEVDEPEGGIDRVGRVSDAIEATGQNVVQGLKQISPAIQSVVYHVRDMVDKPDKLSLQFGIKFTAAAGVVVAKAATEANFTVTVEWMQLPGA